MLRLKALNCKVRPKIKRATTAGLNSLPNVSPEQTVFLPDAPYNGQYRHAGSIRFDDNIDSYVWCTNNFHSSPTTWIVPQYEPYDGASSQWSTRRSHSWFVRIHFYVGVWITTNFLLLWTSHFRWFPRSSSSRYGSGCCNRWLTSRYRYWSTRTRSIRRAI